MLHELTKCISRVNFYLKLVGLSPDIGDDQRNILSRLFHHPIYVIHMISLNLIVIGKFQWLRNAFETGKSFLDITYCFPCLTLCLLSDFISLSLLTYAEHVNDLIKRLDLLQLGLLPTSKEREYVITKHINENTSELLSITKKKLYLICMGFTVIGTRPLLAMYSRYSKTGEVLYLSPLFVSYPFDRTDMRIFPIIYVHQIFTAIQTLFLVYGPFCLFLTCCAFIRIQIEIMKYDIENVMIGDELNYDVAVLKSSIKQLITRHMELLKCVELLELIYSKSILFNAFTSSMMICVTGFNIMANDDVMTVAFFTSFLIYSLLQIFFFCYYGDNIMRSSTQVSDAVYNSQWYAIDVKERRTLLIMLMRAQRPCKITAYGFFDINLRAFTSILNKSWSYFALLKTIYHPE